MRLPDTWVEWAVVDKLADGVNLPSVTSQANPSSLASPLLVAAQETVPAAVQFCDASMAAELKATGDGASVCWLSPDHALLCLRSGQLLQLALLQQAAGGGARKVAVARAGAAPQPSCCCTLGDGSGSTASSSHPPALLFFGSAAGDSLLVRASPAAAAADTTPAAAGTKRPADGSDSGLPTSKRLRLESFEAAVDAAEPGAAGSNDSSAAQEGAAAAAAEGASGGAGSDSEDEEALIYGTALLAPTADAPAAPQQQLQRYQLKVLDSLANIGPVRDFAIADASTGASCAVPPFQQRLHESSMLARAAGRGCLLRTGLRLP